MSMPPELAQQLARQYSVERLKPVVRFYDHAIRDDAKSSLCGRERFKPAVYIEKIKRNGAAREVFARKMVAEDKQEWADEWTEYLMRKDAFANRRPPLEAIPGLDAASHAELKALGLTNCELVANFDSDLFELEPFRATAKTIMEMSDAIRERRTDHGTQRAALQAGVQDSVQREGSVHRTGTDARSGYTSDSSNGFSPQAGEAFRYEVKVA